jgi:RNA polymerase sigma factor (sigma-70 family)
MELSDEALVLACRRGDATAWNTLVDRYQMLITVIARRSGLDADEAADVLQQVFTLLLERLDTIERPAYLGAWLATTTRYEAWRLHRRSRSVPATVDLAGYAEQLVDGGPLPDEHLQRLEQQHLVRLAVASLDERCRRLLTLLFFRPDPPPYAEIAAALGMREGGVGPTRARCLQKLRQLLRNHDL